MSFKCFQRVINYHFKASSNDIKGRYTQMYSNHLSRDFRVVLLLIVLNLGGGGGIQVSNNRGKSIVLIR